MSTCEQSRHAGEQMDKKKVAIIVLIAFGLGIYFSLLRNDSKTLAQMKKSDNEVKQKQLLINNKSHDLEKKLQLVKEYETQNHKKTTTDSSSANTHCVNFDFVELFNQQSAEFEKILSTKHVNKMQ